MTKNKKEKEVIPEPEIEVETEPEQDEVKEEAVAIIPNFIDIYNDIEDIDNKVMALLKQKKALMKTLQKTYTSDLKKARKNRRSKSSEEKGERTPSGFNKPSVVPEKICDVLGLEYGTELARTAVTKQLYHYIKENGLQNEDDKRVINPNDELIELFQLKKGDELTFNTFQTYMKRLYPSKDEVAEVVEVIDEKKEEDVTEKKKKKKSK
jgi:chromatin remodeling complex protein RSC6